MNDWEPLILEEKAKPYMQSLLAFLSEEQKQGKVIYPAKADRMAAFKYTPFSAVRVVLLGQDPYHSPGAAMGLSFSVPAGHPLPPSLINIYQELEQDLGCPAPRSGSLIPWAQQGVLLLNRVLTVEAGRAASHAKKGWELFTDRVLSAVLQDSRPKVFILWGSHALKAFEHCVHQTYGSDALPAPHGMIASPHPSPLSAYRGFFGSRPFSRTNDMLLSQGQKPIDWGL